LLSFAQVLFGVLSLYLLAADGKLSMNAERAQILIATDLPYPSQVTSDRYLALGGQPWELAWSSADRYYEVARDIVAEAWAVLALIEQALPSSLTTPRPGQAASIWDGMRDVFAYRAIAPLLGRKQFIMDIARQWQAEAIESREHLGSVHWWNGLASVGEAARAAAGELSLPYRGRPGMVGQALRRWLVGPTGSARAIMDVLRRGYRVPKPPPTSTPDVLFLARGPTLVPIISAIAEKLREYHNLTSLVLDFEPGGMAEMFEQAEVPHCAADSLVPARASQAAWLWFYRGRRLMKSYRHHANLLRLSDQLSSSLLGAIELRLAYTLAAYTPRAAYHNIQAGNVLNQLAPKLVVSFHLQGDEDGMNAVVVEAQKRGWPTVFVQHGIMGTRKAMMATLPYKRVLVFHQPAAELLNEKGAAPATEIVGSPLYDNISVSQSTCPDKGYVLVASQPDERIERRRSRYYWLPLVFDACHTLGCSVILKVHPADGSNIPAYQRLAQQTAASVRIVPHGEEPLSRLMAGCSLFISRFSTTLLDAVLANKPAVMVNFTGQPDPYPFTRLGAVVAVRTPQDLQPTLQRLLEDPTARAALNSTRQEYIDYHIGPTDGQAADRIAATLAQCVSTPAPRLGPPQHS